ncbi:MAG: methyl-accepting chemotaxis protein [bacterium]
MLVSFSLILMSIFLGNISQNNLLDTSKSLSDMSVNSVQKTGNNMIDVTEGVMSKTNTDSMNLSSKTLTETSNSLVKESKSSIEDISSKLTNLSHDKMNQTNHDILAVTEKAIKNTGDSLINTSQNYLIEAVTDKNKKEADEVSGQISNSIGNCMDILEMITKFKDIKNLTAESVQYFITSAQKSYMVLTNISVANKTGDEIAKVSTDEVVTTTDLKNISTNQAFESAVKGKKYISEVKTKLGYSYVTVGIPIWQYPGRTSGALIADIRLSNITELVSKKQIGKTGFCFVVDDNGKILFHPNRQININASDLLSLNNEKLKYKIFKINSNTEVLAVASNVKALNSKVIVVQPTTEAFKAAEEMETVVQKQTIHTLKLMNLSSNHGLKIALKIMNDEAKKAASERAIKMTQKTTKDINSAVNTLKDSSKKSLNSALNNLRPIAKNQSESVLKEIQEQSKGKIIKSEEKIVSHTVILLFIFLAISSVIAVYMAKNIANPIQNLTQVADKIAKDDLSGEIQIEDREEEEIDNLYNTFNNMQHNLKGIISKIASNAENVSSSSKELTTITAESSKEIENIVIAIQNVANGAKNQLDLSENTKTIAYKIAEESLQIKTTTTAVIDSSNIANDKALFGSKVLNELVIQMNVINEKINYSGEIVNVLEKQAEQINKIIEMITSISEQTNLLSLNAAIEAARAGENGKGFAVVADEVRKLATLSKKSAGEVNTVISEIKKEIANVVNSIKDGSTAVKSGLEKTNDANTSFKDIINSFKDVSSQVSNVSELIININTGIQEMVGKINTISEISKIASDKTHDVVSSVEEQNASMEEIAGTASMLSQMSSDLINVVKSFKLN